jgi:hypothetical protein
MTSVEHHELVALGARWLRREGFPVVATELRANGCREQADVIGFRESCSALIEVKVSRADFRVDREKPERADPRLGLGLYRFYLMPFGLIADVDLPTGWGLLYAGGKTVEAIVRPLGNCWLGPGCKDENWARFQHPVSVERERRILFSIARRLSAKPAAKKS